MAETVTPVGFEGGESFQYVDLESAPDWAKEYATMVGNGVGLALPRRKFGQPYSPAPVGKGDTVWTNKSKDEFLIQKMPESPSGFPVSKEEPKLSDDISVHNQLVGEALQKMGNIPSQAAGEISVHDPVSGEDKTVPNPAGAAAEEAAKTAATDSSGEPSAPVEDPPASTTRRRSTASSST